MMARGFDLTPPRFVAFLRHGFTKEEPWLSFVASGAGRKLLSTLKVLVP
jgi:hypothetical protein